MDGTAKLLAALWVRNRPQVMERVALLECAANADPLTAELRAEAISTAHKLAGSLGMYGFPAGTDAARGLEQELEAAAPDRLRLQAFCEDLNVALAETKCV